MIKLNHLILLILTIGLFNCEKLNNDTAMVQIPQDVFYIPENSIKYSSMENGIDQLYFGQLELSEEQLKPFIEKNGLNEIQNKKEKPFFNEDHSDVSWWTPDETEIKFAGTHKVNEWIKEVLVSKKEQKYLVFFRVYSI